MLNTIDGITAHMNPPFVLLNFEDPLSPLKRPQRQEDRSEVLVLLPLVLWDTEAISIVFH